MKKDYTKAIGQVGDILDLWLPLKIGYEHTPGIAVAITHKGKLVYARGFGMADIEEKKKMTTHTGMRIASISKTVTAAAVMQLVEKGMVRLEDPAATYIPWLKRGSAKVTVEDLLAHGAGIFRDGDTDHWDGGRFPDNLEKSLSKKSFVSKRGASFKYSNYGYSLLGLVIEKASGMKYEDYVRHHILNPLGMRSTYIDFATGMPGLASGYGRYIPGLPNKKFPQYKTNAYAPATGLVSTAEDTAKLAASFLLGASPRILKESSKKKMAEERYTTGLPIKYGFGLDIYEMGAKKIYGHSGGFMGFNSQFLFDAKEDLAVVVLSNGNGAPTGFMARGILELLYAGSATTKKGKAADYKPYVGVYRDIWRDMICAPLGDTLMGFRADADLPMKSSWKLTQTNKKGQFVITCDNLYDLPGEEVVFTDIKGGKAHTIRTSGFVSSRL